MYGLYRICSLRIQLSFADVHISIYEITPGYLFRSGLANFLFGSLSNFYRSVLHAKKLETSFSTTFAKKKNTGRGITKCLITN